MKFSQVLLAFASRQYLCTRYHDHDIVPVKQQEVLHDFLLKVNHGTFGIPCGGKVCHSSPGMNHVSWPMKKYVFLSRTLAQLACQDFKKELPDSNSCAKPPVFLCVTYSGTAQLWQYYWSTSFFLDKPQFWHAWFSQISGSSWLP